MGTSRVVPPVSLEVTAFVRVHNFVSATSNMNDPALKESGSLPRFGHERKLVVVGASVMVVGFFVGSVFLFLVGENVG